MNDPVVHYSDYHVKTSGNNDYHVKTAVNDHKYKVSVSTAIVAGGGIPYEGEYIVTPKAFEETILETRNKLMADDVTVLEIPYWETSNPDGKTVYIAGEVEINHGN